MSSSFFRWLQSRHLASACPSLLTDDTPERSVRDFISLLGLLPCEILVDDRLSGKRPHLISDALRGLALGSCWCLRCGRLRCNDSLAMLERTRDACPVTLLCCRFVCLLRSFAHCAVRLVALSLRFASGLSELLWPFLQMLSLLRCARPSTLLAVLLVTHMCCFAHAALLS